MVCTEDINAALDKMILSASGWRGIFAAPDLSGENGAYDDEESTSDKISEVHMIIAAAAALIFAEYLIDRVNSHHPLVLIGSDTRPTGRKIIEAIVPVLLACGCKVSYAGFTAAPEIMAWARSINNSAEPERIQAACGFIYISASHNPIGHNGLKFGLTDGGVLAGEQTAKLIANFRAFFKRGGFFEKIESLMSAAEARQLDDVYNSVTDAKERALRAYYNFCGDVVWGNSDSIASAFKDGIKKRPLGIVCDFNGSARTVSIDREFFSSLGLKFDFINGKPGQIVHSIVPEGESLKPCCALLEEARSRDASFTLGYMPDCDGDRGNLVVWDDVIGKVRALEAQEVFALACIAELSHLVWTGSDISKAAVAVNDPTSMRIDRIAEAFGVSVFRAEVGEANVVGLARRLREQGYIVRILGEGSAGGNITHPSAVRDPLNTVLAIAKMLLVRSTAQKPGLFEIWLKLSRQFHAYRDDFTLADIIASLLPFVSTPAYSKDAVLRIDINDHSLLKERYQKIFLREWEERKDELKTRYGIYSWQAIAYNALEEKRDLIRFGESGRGGLKIGFFDSAGRMTSFIWMRGSATEPVFRIMADTEGSNIQVERDLLFWQRRMIMEAGRIA